MDLRLVENLLAQKFEEEEFSDCFLIDLEYSNGNNKLQVFIDSDSEFGFVKCRRISRYLEAYFDENEILGAKYTLEVSSPGLSRPLKFKRQYIKNVGKLLKIELVAGDKIEGKIKEVQEEQIVMEIKNITRKINFEMIKSAKVVPSFK